MGKKAGIKTQPKPKGKTKFASAHDLRRSFGERWSSRMMPPVLMELMRHESIETTMRFYVGRNAQSTADVLYEAIGKGGGQGDSLGDSGQKQAPGADQTENAKPSDTQKIEERSAGGSRTHGGGFAIRCLSLLAYGAPTGRKLGNTRRGVKAGGAGRPMPHKSWPIPALGLRTTGDERRFAPRAAIKRAPVVRHAGPCQF